MNSPQYEEAKQKIVLMYLSREIDLPTYIRSRRELKDLQPELPQFDWTDEVPNPWLELK